MGGGVEVGVGGWKGNGGVGQSGELIVRGRHEDRGRHGLQAGVALVQCDGKPKLQRQAS